MSFPANTTATVMYPLAKGQTEVYESDIPADKAEGVKLVSKTDTHAVYEIGSGSYSFTPDGTLGVEDIKAGLGTVTVRPNPARDYVEILTDSPVAEVTACGITGTACGTLPVTGNRVDVTRLSPGLYILSLKTRDGQSLTTKLIKL